MAHSASSGICKVISVPALQGCGKDLQMVKDRKSLLQQIYEDEFYPSETVVSGDPDYVTKGHQSGEEIEYIASRLDAGDKVRFDKLMDLMGEMGHMDMPILLMASAPGFCSCLNFSPAITDLLFAEHK